DEGAGRLERIEKTLVSLRSILISLLVFALTIVIIGQVLLENRETITLDPIEVPKDFADRGDTPVVLAHRLYDEIRAIYETGSKAFPFSGESRPMLSVGRSSSATGMSIELPGDRADIQVPVSGLSVRSAVRYAKNLLGVRESHLGGDISRDGEQLRLVLRGFDNTSVAIKTGDNVKDILASAALDVVKRENPLMLARYLYVRENDARSDEKAEDAIKYCLKNRPEDNK